MNEAHGKKHSVQKVEVVVGATDMALQVGRDMLDAAVAHDVDTAERMLNACGRAAESNEWPDLSDSDRKNVLSAAMQCLMESMVRLANRKIEASKAGAAEGN